MRMDGGFFWGFLLIIIGLTIIIRVVFDINIPVFRIIIAFFFIFFGLKILISGLQKPQNSDTFENSPNYESDSIFSDNSSKEQNILFGHSVIDLRQIKETSFPDKKEINAIFGSGEIIIRKDMNIRIKVDSAFGGVLLPDNNTSAFGTTIYETPVFNPLKPFLYLKISVVFGNVLIKAL